MRERVRVKRRIGWLDGEWVVVSGRVSEMDRGVSLICSGVVHAHTAWMVMETERSVEGARRLQVRWALLNSTDDMLSVATLHSTR